MIKNKRKLSKYNFSYLVLLSYVELGEMPNMVEKNNYLEFISGG